ncbi:hypothetical protein K435DRAFT_496941 [Dendrothele bispora CBS 962.96]|uniref:Uncharacterized protein n=1 Tax=Dendrothele bispora (strain CBS 962.96) TaxID=1314807 RepID=A0A4S8KXA3_DENBC|nr:hypothetical protein K435DRAFT_496941 [Dendrothele bispora CBS 962.96]
MKNNIFISKRQNATQSSLTLDSRVIATGFTNDGQDVPLEGHVGSLTSTNNFINFCLTSLDVPITNGVQISTGSCNPAPIGALPSVDKMPSIKFISPRNGDTVSAGQSFTMSLAVQKLSQGVFTSFNKNFLSAPQQLDSQGLVQGYYAVVIDQLFDSHQISPTDPQNDNVYWRPILQKVVNGIVTVDITKGLPPGSYRVTSTAYAMNHQPVFAPVEQHGFFGDVVYVSLSFHSSNFALISGLLYSSMLLLVLLLPVL